MLSFQHADLPIETVMSLLQVVEIPFKELEAWGNFGNKIITVKWYNYIPRDFCQIFPVEIIDL